MKILFKTDKLKLGQEDGRFFITDNRKFVRYYAELKDAEEDLERCLKTMKHYDKS